MKTKNILMICISLLMAAFITPAIAGHVGSVNIENINIVPMSVFTLLFASSFIPMQAGLLFTGFTNVNIGKPGRNAGVGGGLRDHVIFFDWEDVATEPLRDDKGVKMVAGNIVFQPGAHMSTMYSTPGSIVNQSKSEGEIDQEGIVQVVKYSHPGSELEAREWRANMLSRSLGLIHRKCVDPTKMDVYGTKCVPLRLSFDWTHDKDKNVTEFTFTSAGRGPDVGIYSGACTWNEDSGSE